VEKVPFAIKKFGFGTEPAYNRKHWKNAAKQLIKKFCGGISNFCHAGGPPLTQDSLPRIPLP
jgi:hypothetical protein